MNITEQYRRILKTLALATHQSRVNWLSTADDKLYVLLQGLTLQLSKDMSPLAGIFQPAGGQYTITIYDADGNEVDSFTVEPSDDEHAIVQQMYNNAHRQVSGIQQTLSQLEDQLDTPNGMIGKPATESDITLPPNLAPDQEHD